MSEPTIGLGEPYLIDPATDPALCVACYTDECGRCRPPCDCPHDGRRQIARWRRRRQR